MLNLSELFLLLFIYVAQYRLLDLSAGRMVAVWRNQYIFSTHWRRVYAGKYPVCIHGSNLLPDGYPRLSLVGTP